MFHKKGAIAPICSKIYILQCIDEVQGKNSLH